MVAIRPTLCETIYTFRGSFDDSIRTPLTVTYCNAQDTFLDYVDNLEQPSSTLSASTLFCGGMPGVEVVHPVRASSSNEYLNGFEVPSNSNGVASSPTWSGNGEIPWPKAGAVKEQVSHVARASSLDRYPADSSHVPWPLHEQYAENQHVSPQVNPRVDGLLGAEDAVNGDRRVFKPHKPLPRRRYFTDNSANLRSQFNTAETESSIPSNGDIRLSPSPSTPVISSPTHSLPPTPPSLHHEVNECDFENSSNAETTILRSHIVTPTPQHSPPTPDNTPPRLDPPRKRPFLGTQPSLASTKAESFQTAREEISSDDEEESFPVPTTASVPQWLHTLSSTNKAPFQVRPSPLTRDDGAVNAFDRVLQNEVMTSSATKELDERYGAQMSDLRSTSATTVSDDPPPHNPLGESPPLLVAHDASDHDVDHSLQHTLQTRPSLPTPPLSAGDQTAQATPDNSVEMAQTMDEDPALTLSRSGYSPADAATEAQFPRRGRSLRERLEESHKIEASHSTEQFGNEIGWSQPTRSSDLKTRVDSWRLSGISTASTVEAIVVDREPKRQQTLRHRGRNASLRSASSPIPNSNRNSLLSNQDSPHRLVHKRARLSNHNRWSFGSELSRPHSMSSATAPHPKPEIIHVAVIPERTSSLRSSANSSNGRSASLSTSSGGQRFIQTGSRGEGSDLPHHRRAVSESFTSGINLSNRGRDKRFPPPVPARSSSLSARTSQSNSRANSITSEHLRLRRVAAEEDVRKTLARMESERAAPIDHPPTPPSGLPDRASLEPETEHWANLRPPSAQRTPFSQRSLHSTSPVVEMGEARAVNFFAHNNHSLQLIESNHLPESRAVQGLYTSSRDLQVATHEPATPVASLLPILSVESPLRNPREPPKPPQFKVIPPTPAGLTPTNDSNGHLETKGPSRRGSGRRFGSLRRPSIANRRHSGSFVRSFGRSLSLNAKNKKADQDLDGTLHPFWRPRGFWDGFSESDNEESDRYQNRDRDIVVNNSLGMPQQRTIIDGPLSLVRKISGGSRRRRQNRGVSKRSSYSSLSRLRAGRKIYKVPGLGLRFQVLGFRHLQQRMLSVNGRKEDKRRDKRREELRRSIGPNVISQGDSRYISPRIVEPSSGLTPDMD